MTGYNREHQLNIDNQSPDESADILGERADELFDERMDDPEAVTDAVEEVLGFSDWADSLAGDMAAVLMASDAAFEAEAVRFFARLHKRVEKDIRDEAEAEAESEAEMRDQYRAEMRDLYLGEEA